MQPAEWLSPNDPLLWFCLFPVGIGILYGLGSWIQRWERKRSDR
jgi:hypothetical protein